MNRNIVAAILAIGLLCMSGCADVFSLPESGGTTQPPQKWTVVPYLSTECSCRSARAFYLVNTSSASPASITLTEYASNSHGDNPPPQLRGFPEVFRGEVGKKFLQCSPSGPDCRLTYHWDVEGRIFGQGYELLTAKAKLSPAEKSTIAAVSSSYRSVVRRDAARLAAITSNKALSAPRTDCVAACKDGSSSCLFGSLQGAQGNPTKAFVDLVRAQGNDGTVPVASLLQILRQEGNPCGRTDISIRDGELINSGLACIWQGAEGSAFALQVRVPSTLMASINATGPLVADFRKPALHAPSIHFADAGLDRKFGGVVHKVEQARFLRAGKERPFLVLTGQESCVAVREE